jgi:hypothetical protein
LPPARDRAAGLALAHRALWEGGGGTAGGWVVSRRRSSRQLGGVVMTPIANTQRQHGQQWMIRVSRMGNSP